MGEADEVNNNVFDDADRKKVPVKVIVDGKEIVVGEATVLPGKDNIVHVDMDLKTDDPNDITELFGNGITGYSMAVTPAEERTGPKHRTSDAEIQDSLEIPRHDHKPIQHRDGKPPWCNICRRDAEYHIPKPRFNFGKPANPLRGER